MVLFAEGTGRTLRKRKSAPVYYPDPAEPEGEASSSESEASQESESSQEPANARSKKSASPAAKKDIAGKEAGGKLPKNWVQCPCCQQNFPMAIFNDHLDG